MTFFAFGLKSPYMKSIARYLKNQIIQDLNKKMVFLGGPRQVGKTTLSRTISSNFGYLNWDESTHRTKILNNQLPEKKLIVLDELHKYKQWRNWLKGKFDTLKNDHQFLITGSARLDLYRYSGDSLQGRYFYHRLLPLSVAELKIKSSKDFKDLLKLSGFPEPFFAGSEKEYRRWSKDYRSRLFRDDIQTIERIEDLGTMELLSIRLPDLVGSPLSINALREDLQTSFKKAARYLDILERNYSFFRISPFGSPKIRAVKKEQKHYHYDWALCPDDAQRLENLVGCHLLKWVYFQEDTEGLDIELRYFRDSDGREVDFVVVQNKHPILFVEVKSSSKSISPHLKYLKNKYPETKAVQVHTDEKVHFVSPEGIISIPVWKFLADYI